MSTGRATHRRAAAGLGLTGGVLGVFAGTVQAFVGGRIPEWTGAKQAAGSLGLLTIAVSLLAGYAAHRQARPHTSVGSRAGYAACLLVPGLLCFSTVGRLWYLPGPLLLVASMLTIDSIRETARLITTNWSRCLLVLLGAAELVMAAGAGPVLMAVGAVGGAALIAAGTLARSRSGLVALAVVGTVPFTVLAWTAVIPVLLLFTAVAVVVPLTRHPWAEPGLRP